MVFMSHYRSGVGYIVFGEDPVCIGIMVGVGLTLSSVP